MARRLNTAALCCGVGLLLIYACCPNHASAQSGSIVGQIRIAPGNEIKAPVLVILSTRGAPISQIYTDNEGHFGFNSLPGNLYHLEINEEGYQPIQEEIPIDPVTASTRVLTLYLVPRDAKAKGSTSVTGGNTRLSDVATFRPEIPKSARKQFDKGVKNDRAGKVEEAIGFYKKALEFDPKFYEARNNLGSDLLSRSQFLEARKQFEQVIVENPSDGLAYFNLGNLFLLTRQAEQAQLWIERGLSRQPDSALGHFLQGSLYELTGRFKEAETSLRRSIELDPLMAKAHLALVNLYLQTKRDEQAVSELRAFLTAFPKDPFAPKAKEVLKRLSGSPAASDPLTH